MHEKRFNRPIERLRDPERLKMLEVSRVIDLSLEGCGANISVLDVGTGSGIFAEGFAARGLIVSGLDANPQMLVAASQFVPAGEFKIGVAEEVPFADQSFDLIFMGLLLHETDDAQKALEEAYRVTRRRLSVLEWPEDEPGYGPPLTDRLTHQTITEMGNKAGFHKVQYTRLNKLVLYLLDR